MKNDFKKELCYLYNIISDYDTIELLKTYKKDVKLNKLVDIWETFNLQELDTCIYYDIRDNVLDYLCKNYGFYLENDLLNFKKGV